MQNKNNAGLRFSKKAVWRCILGVIIVLFGVFVYRLNQVDKTELVVRTGQTFEKAEVTEILQDNLEDNGTRVGEQKVRVRMLTGVRKGEELEITSSSGYLFGAVCKVGMKVIVMQSVAGNTTIASVYTQDREWVIYIFVALYLLALCIIGGRQGIKGCIGLVFTFFCVIFVYLPMIYRNISPFGSAVFVCFITTLVTMYMIGGANRKTIAATAGTVAGVVIAGISAQLFSMASGITGYNVSDIENLIYVRQITSIKVGELLFSGIIISALGAVTDVGVSVASTIQEIHQTDPNLGKRKLFLSGIHVGRDMMGTMVDTLILAYVGTALSTLVTNYAYDLSYNQLINSNNIGIEIMQSLAGSLGIVLAVPITAFVAVELIYRKPKEEKAVAEQMSDSDNESMPEGISVSEN